MRGALSRLRSWLHGGRAGRRIDMEMAEEFRAHMDMRAEDLERGGLSPGEARRRARLEFGAVDRYREEGRAGRGLRVMDELRTDVRQAARSLRRTPLFTVIAVLTLALGVGANTAMFGLVNATLLRPLPYSDPDRLVTLYQERETGVPFRWSPPEYAALRSTLTSLTDVAAWYGDDVNLTASGSDPERARVELISSSYLPLLGVTPVSGRNFVEDDERTAAPVVMIGHDLWTARFGRDAGVAGRIVHVNGIALTVVGVAPPHFRGVSGTADIWVLHAIAPQVYMAGFLESDQRFLSIAARLGPGATVEQAEDELAGEG
ncbi:MAG: ABC transporter permease, partial [Gemmatimonadetes bacterium]|nr:ABC transporter permease [Gemmatimonadota bacterium]